MTNAFNFKPIFAILLTLVNFVVIGVIAWSCFYGLDLSDESYYYMGYLYSDSIPDLSPASFHLVYSRFFSFFHLSLSEVRLLRLALTILAATLLFFSLEKPFLQNNKWEKVTLFHILLSGMLLSYAWAPLALSYNSMSSISLCLILGFWIMTLTNHNVHLRALYTMVLGVLFGLLFFIKITNIILLPILAVLTVYLHYKKKPFVEIHTKIAPKEIVVFLLGAITIFAIISNGLGSIPTTVHSYIQDSFGIASYDSTHSLGYLLKRYTNNAEMILKKIQYPGLILFIGFVSVKILSIKGSVKRKALLLVLYKIIGISVLLHMVYKNQYWQGGTAYKYIILVPYIYVVLFAFFTKLLNNKKVDYVLLVTLIGLPLVGAIGTNNGLSGQVLFYGVFIFMMIYYLVGTSQKNWHKNFLATFLIILSASQVISATVFHPYRQKALTHSQNELTGIDVLKNLKVDQATFNLRKELTFLEEIEASHVFAFSSQRGMTLLANKKPYSLEWFNNNAIGKMCSIIDKSTIAPSDIIFLTPSAFPIPIEVVSCLEENGVFLNDFRLIKKFKYFDPYFKKELELDVYIP